MVKALKNKGLLLVLVILFASLFSGYVVNASEPLPGATPINQQKAAPTGPLSKASSDLLNMMEVAGGLASGQSLLSAMPETAQWIFYRDGSPLLDFWLNTKDAARVNAVVSQLQAFGCTITGTYPQYGRVYAVCDLTLLGQIAAINDISVIYPSYKPVHHKDNRLHSYSIAPVNMTPVTGPILSGVDQNADKAMKSDQVRTTYGVNGSGIKLGVISDSFNATGTKGTVSGSGCNQTITGTSSQTSGNLPATVYLLQDYASGSDEGRAMSELVYDVAPGATLLFDSADVGGEAGFAAAITALANCGANVIVDDVFYFNEPFFQDGIVAQAAANAVTGGVAYFSSAGNEATYGVSATFNDDGTGYHKFSSGNSYAKITMHNGNTLRLVMQWNDPFIGSPGAGAGASHDLNIYLTNLAGTTTYASSTTVQGCSSGSPAGNPYELIVYQNTSGADRDVYVRVKKICGSGSPFFRIANISNGSTTGFDTAIFKDPTMVGHALATGVVSVAAMDARSNPLTLEPFTSLGANNIPFYFDSTGAPLSATRTGPIITSFDDLDTQVWGCCFFGTSAAAPNAAAVGALVLSYKSMPPSALTTLLTGTATAVGSSGWQPLSGYGFINALSAFQSISTFTVTPSAGSNGTISPSTPQTVAYNVTTQFTVTPNSGYIASVGGTCGGTLTGNTYTTLPITANCTVVATFFAYKPVSDFDGTGNSDILLRNSSTGDVAIWLMNGTTIKSGGYAYTSLPSNLQIVGVGDFDGDGKSDILFRNSSTGDVVIWLMNGTTIKSSGTVYSSLASSWQIAGVGDFDGDGKSDILFRNSSTGDVAIWLMSGTTIKSSGYAYTSLASSWQIAGVGDFDG
ncbi:MAG: VCBS repeat-containing protein, partial [Nitrospirae bacterium]|nr:VCBS repeat-containing protein [Nitrospirota bacterium]